MQNHEIKSIVPKSLKQSEMDSYHIDGFTKSSHKIFNHDDYTSLKSTVFNILEKKGGIESSKTLGAVHLQNPELLFWILSGNVLDLAEDILGPNIGLVSSSVFFKKAKSGEKAYWHKDTSGIYTYDLFEDKNLINLIISLSDSDISNGCLRYAPGSHLKNINHSLLAPSNELISYSLAVNEDQLDMSSVRYLELKENEASLHNVNVVHGSEPNQSDRDRLLLSCRFFSASKSCHLENFRKNGLRPYPFLVRGDDIAGSGLKVLKLREF